MSDTRLSNWRFVVPDDGDPLLLLPADGEARAGATVVERDARSLRAALQPGAFHGVVASDLSVWERIDGRGAAVLLRRLAEVPPPGGWLYAAFPNPLVRARGGLGLRKALRVLDAAGLDGAAYVILPSQRRPAWLIPVRRRAELDVFLRRMAFPYAPLRSPVAAWLAARALQVGRLLALVLPHRLRVRFAPAYAVVARRPA